jgi:hypothetical protein
MFSIPENRRRPKLPLSQINVSFHVVTDGDPQLVHIACGQRGTSGCQANYFRKFRATPPFSYSREKGLNHNGFVKMHLGDVPPQPVPGNQIP